MLLGEAHVGEDVRLGLVQQRCELGQLGADLVGDLAPLGLGGAGVVLGEGGGDEGSDDALAVAAGMGERVAHEVHAAALPGRAEHAGDSGLDALVRVRDHQLDAGEAAAFEPAQDCAKRVGGHGLLTFTRYKGAMCDAGNPCARRKGARPEGARAGSIVAGADLGDGAPHDLGRSAPGARGALYGG